MELVLIIGKYPIKLIIEEPSLYDSALRTYRDFLSSSNLPDSLSLFIQIKKDQDIQVNHSYRSLFRHQELEVNSSAFQARVNFVNQVGSITLFSSQPKAALEIALRYIVAYYAFIRGGFLFHGAGIIHNDQGFIFFGPSGSGKTTVARLSPGDMLLNDDLVIVDYVSGSWWMYATPFTNNDQNKPSPLKHPLMAMFRLIQDREVFIEKINLGAALGELIANIPLVTLNKDLAPQLLQMGQVMLESVSLHRLHFLPDDSFWRVVEMGSYSLK